MRKPVIAFICLLSGCWITAQVCLLTPTGTSWAQDKTKKTSKKKGSSTALDVKANEIQNGFIKDAEELANEYYELKEYDKARVLLKSIQALDPSHAKLDAKLKLLDEDLINQNELEMEVNTAKAWEASGVLVGSGKPIRLKAEGAYKFAVSSQVGPNGFSIPAKAATPADMVPELPIGALIGIVIPTDVANRNAQQDDKKKENRPFLIGEGCDYTPPKDGMLYIRVNAPPDNSRLCRSPTQTSLPPPHQQSARSIPPPCRSLNTA
jgi:hypothetical protein